MTKKEKKTEKVVIEPPVLKRMTLIIEGVTSLIQDRKTSEKIQKGTRPEKDEEKQFRTALYPKANGHYTHPSMSIRRAVISTAHTFAESVPKTKARGAFDIPQDFIEIVEGKPTKRKDIVNNPNSRSAAIEKTRAEFKNWKAKFPIVYDANGPLTVNQIINLINMAGFYVGIGCFRPEKGGIHGRFEVKKT